MQGSIRLKTDDQWKNIYRMGGIAAVIALLGILLDVILGSMTGGNLNLLPQSAIDRYAQFQINPWLGLYNLDLLNVINQIISIPVYFALFAVHRKTDIGFALFALIIFLVGSIIFITTNTALPMLDLSTKYSIAANDFQKTLYAAAGEAMLARGSHGSPGVFIGFLLSNISSLLMSVAMIRGRVFSKATSYLGIIGSALLFIYIILVTFVPIVKEEATLIAMPGGLLSMAWMVMFTIRLFQLSRNGVEF